MPQELCKLTKTMTTTLTLGYNVLDLTPDPYCPKRLDPGWMKTQTVPPTDIRATAVSTSSIRLTWKPIAYTGDGGGYEVRYSTMPGDPESYIVAGTVVTKSASSYTVTNLAAGTTYHFAVQTHTPSHGYQRNDLWSAYSRDVTTATLIPDGTLITLKEETAAGRPVSGAEVVAYRGAITVAQGTTNAHGQVVFDDLQAEDSILARSLQHEQPSAKAQHHSGAEPDWSYRVYLTDLDIRPNGYVSRTVVGQPGQQLTTTVKRDNALVLFNLVASTEWNASEDELNFLRDEMIKASDFLYDVTDGQFAFGHVDIYDDAQHLRDADLRILASNQVIPNAIVGGIAATDTFTYTSSAGRTTVYTPGFLRMQPAWDTDKEYPQCGGFCRTLVHEFAHYGLFLYDEYYKFEDGKAVEAHCTSPDPQDIAGGASIMDQPYKTSELAMRDTLQWSPEYCEKTEQWNIHEESDWETVTRVYTDTERSPAAPRWEFKTPRTLGRVANPGPVVIPISLTAIITHDVPFQSTPITASVEVSLSSANKQAQVFLFKGDPFTSITEVGSPITSTIKVWGLEVGDELKAVTTDGSEFASQDVTSTAKPLELRPTTWKPRIEALPDSLSLQGPRIRVWC